MNPITPLYLIPDELIGKVSVLETGNWHLNWILTRDEKVTSNNCQELVNILNTYPQITSLTFLNYNNLTLSIKPLIEAVKKSTSLTALTLNVHNTDADQLLFDVLQNNTLTKLTVGNDSISDTFILLLANGLATNTGLTTLTLQGRALTDAGIQTLATALEKNRTLRSLNLCTTHRVSGATQSLINIIQKNSSLTDLNLALTKLDDKDIQLLANWLANNNSLIKLDISHNPYINSFKPLANALHHNASLEKLSGTNFNSEDFSFFVNALKTNTTFTELSTGGLYPPHITRDLDVLCRRNKKIAAARQTGNPHLYLNSLRQHMGPQPILSLKTLLLYDIGRRLNGFVKSEPEDAKTITLQKCQKTLPTTLMDEVSAQPQNLRRLKI